MDDYDEFGNYIGPELVDDFSSHLEEKSPKNEYSNDEMEVDAGEQELTKFDEKSAVPINNAIVLHEDKKYYPTAEEVYGKDVEAMVQEEDTQPLTQPIIAPPKKVKKEIYEESTKEYDSLPSTIYNKRFLLDVSKHPNMIRNISFVGHLHHGKTSLLSCLVDETHDISSLKNQRYSDNHEIEISRGISIKSTPMSLLLPNGKGKSFLFNIMDTPGHSDFFDEVNSSLSISDGAVLIVDCVEGVMMTTERCIRHFMKHQMPFVLVINKIDRLVVELKIPPEDAYYKIFHTISEINSIISSFAIPDWEEKFLLSPERGNVCFASPNYGFVFSVGSFALLYANLWENCIPVHDLALRLWGDVYYHTEKKRFVKTMSDAHSCKRSFVHFILEPMYKIFSHVLGEDEKSLRNTLLSVGIDLGPKILQMDVKPLLRVVCKHFFGSASSVLADCVLNSIPSPVENAPKKVAQIYSGPLSDPFSNSMFTCESLGPLMIHIVKLYPSSDENGGLYAFGRIYSGTVHVGETVKVLGEGYSPDDEEDMSVKVVSGSYIFCSRYRIYSQSLSAGNWVMLEGVDGSIVKNATITKTELTESIHVFRPMHLSPGVFKIAIEPMNPSDLPKMMDSLRKLNKTYGLLNTRVEESGEHIIFGPGEMYLDCVLHDLRKLSGIDVRVSDPSVRFCETVVETSSLQCWAETANKRNKITMVAEPLEDGIASDIENNLVFPNPQKFFKEKYQWDALAVRGIWAFGPDDSGPNMLIDDTLPGEVDKKLLNTVKDYMKQGFQWATREGPLCDERNI
jgi:U5 small nuclear ribonucleoprotein component